MAQSSSSPCFKARWCLSMSELHTMLPTSAQYTPSEEQHSQILTHTSGGARPQRLAIYDVQPCLTPCRLLRVTETKAAVGHTNEAVWLFRQHRSTAALRNQLRTCSHQTGIFCQLLAAACNCWTDHWNVQLLSHLQCIKHAQRHLASLHGQYMNGSSPELQACA